MKKEKGKEAYFRVGLDERGNPPLSTMLQVLPHVIIGSVLLLRVRIVLITAFV